LQEDGETKLLSEELVVERINFVIQGSSRSWDGGADLCMNLIDGVPTIKYTVLKIINEVPNSEVIVVAPEYDKGGKLESIFSDLLGMGLRLYFGYNESPLARILAATEHLSDQDYVIRIDGLHHGVMLPHVLDLLGVAEANDAFLVKDQDDFPVQLTGDVYRVEALRRLLSGPISAPHHVHPKYAILEGYSERAIRVEPPPVSDDYLLQIRERSKSVYLESRLAVDDLVENSGSQMLFHYQLALEFLEESSRVLDIACGDGFGSRFLAKNGLSVVGGDICPLVIDRALELSHDCVNVEFQVLDVTCCSLEDSSFDAIVSMETIEHVEESLFLAECSRLLRPGGKLILSTPQNCLGHIPVCSEHLREYSLSQLMDALTPRFEVLKVIGIKQGQVTSSMDPIGSNTVVICRKRIATTAQ
jgi:2-polyprenyl-3-methyl-5-hydroxy-6-metoxy-1,4-benzoquinol methylase